MCYELSQLFQDVRTQEVSATTLLCEIELNCVEAMFASSLSHTPRYAENPNEERAGYQREISLFGSCVSAWLCGTDCARKCAVPAPYGLIFKESRVWCWPVTLTFRAQLTLLTRRGTP